MESRSGTAQYQRPRFGCLHHISLPCRDVEESKRFYTQVLGGELIHDIPGFAEVRIADMIFGMSQQSGGWTGPTVEYPHYGLNVDAQNFAVAGRWLEACGVPQHGWTRNYKTALLYCRDPSGNLFEFYCDRGYEDIRELALGPRQGGRPLPLEALQYQWNGAVGNGAKRPRIHSFGHLSIPVSDIEQSKRFFIEVMAANRWQRAIRRRSLRFGSPAPSSACRLAEVCRPGAMSNIHITPFMRTPKISCR